LIPGRFNWMLEDYGGICLLRLRSYCACEIIQLATLVSLGKLICNQQLKGKPVAVI
jgi:hypothetical protein